MGIQIRTIHGNKVLEVNHQPFYAVAGEVHNSDASSPAYMEKIWPVADKLGLNTLLLPVSWELTEPVEGTFDFAIPDALIEQARKWNKKIIFLWFGSWKNAEMMYAPAWVKTDRKRFRRAQIVKGEDKSMRDMGMAKIPYYSLSYLCTEARDADACAFAALMEHIREIDEEINTVIGVQVENETGLLGNARERSDEADRLFAMPVPDGFAAYMKAHSSSMQEDVRIQIEQGKSGGSWEEFFGEAADEIFSAYHVAEFVNAVAKAGKKAYPLPMFANCWIVHKGDRPGQYPSGGPVSRMREVWRFCAPSVDVLCPDIYVPEFLEVCDDYARDGNPLMIPESATHSYAASRLAYCIGHYHAMGYSVFGFDDIGKPFTAMQGYLFGMDVNDPALKVPQDFATYAWFAKTLSGMMPVIAPCYGTGQLQAVCAEKGEDCQFLDLGKLRVSARFQNPLNPGAVNGVALGVRIEEDESYLLAYRCILSFGALDAKNLDILELEEGLFENGSWQRGRRLNGDEAASLLIDAPVLLRVKVYTYDDK